MTAAATDEAAREAMARAFATAMDGGHNPDGETRPSSWDRVMAAQILTELDALGWRLVRKQGEGR